MRRIVASTGIPMVKATMKAMIACALFLAASGAHSQSRVIDQHWEFSPDPKAQFTAATADRQAKWRPAKASLSLERSI